MKQTSGVDEKSDKDGENEKDNENEKDDDEDDDDEDVDDDNDDNDDEESTNKDGRVLNCIHLSGLSIFPHLKDCHGMCTALRFSSTCFPPSPISFLFKKLTKSVMSNCKTYITIIIAIINPIFSLILFKLLLLLLLLLFIL